MKLEAKIDVDVCILSNAQYEELKNVTELGIRTLLESEQNINFNIYVIESNEQVKYDFPNTKTLHTWIDFNYNAYMNFAIDKGSSKYVALCNNDLVYEKNWASNIIKEMEEDNELLSASPFCPNVNTGNGNNVFIGHQIRKQINGWCIFTKRELYKKIGKIDEGVKFWFSDNLYADQLIFNDIKHALVQNSIVYHHENNIGITASSILDDSKIYEYSNGQYNDYLKARYKYEQRNLSK